MFFTVVFYDLKSWVLKPTLQASFTAICNVRYTDNIMPCTFSYQIHNMTLLLLFDCLMISFFYFLCFYFIFYFFLICIYLFIYFLFLFLFGCFLFCFVLFCFVLFCFVFGFLFCFVFVFVFSFVFFRFVLFWFVFLVCMCFHCLVIRTCKMTTPLHKPFSKPPHHYKRQWYAFLFTDNSDVLFDKRMIWFSSLYC